MATVVRRPSEALPQRLAASAAPLAGSPDSIMAEPLFLSDRDEASPST